MVTVHPLGVRVNGFSESLIDHRLTSPYDTNDRRSISTPATPDGATKPASVLQG
jgi:hypothetical protein